ncbi:MAG: hypothetical protein H0U90_10455, partial [Actinobacteria bacterium]|nr:hypothetical protein [Actinomycetota bacterium]
MLLTVFVATVALLASPSALAVHQTNHLELEGDIADNAALPAPDWASLFDATGNPTALGDDCVFVQDDTAQSGATDDTTFASSNKNNDLIATWNWATGNVPLKDDLANVYVCPRFENGDLVIYAGAERLAPEGASHIDFQFYQGEIG